MDSVVVLTARVSFKVHVKDVEDLSDAEDVAADIVEDTLEELADSGAYDATECEGITHIKVEEFEDIEVEEV